MYFALSANAETGFFEDVFNFIYSLFFGSDGYYEHLGLDRSLVSVRLLIVGIFAGAIAACLITAYNKRIVGAVARRIIERGAHTRESALTLAELGYEKRNFLHRMAVSNVMLRKLLRCVGAQDFYEAQEKERAAYERERESGKEGAKGLPKFREQEYLFDLESDRFYLPEENKAKAEIKFEDKGSGFAAAAVGALVLFVCCCLVLAFLPNILGALDSFVGSLG